MSRENTDYLIEQIEEGLISNEQVVTAALKYMSGDDVTGMMEANEIPVVGDEDEEYQTMSSLGRKIHVVHGSEDGTIGVYTTQAKAMARAIEYAKSFGLYDFDALIIDTDSKYHQSVAGPDCMASIEYFILE